MTDRPTTREGWEVRARALLIETRAFIDGRYVAAVSGRTFARRRMAPWDARPQEGGTAAFRRLNRENLEELAFLEVLDTGRVIGNALAVDKYMDLKTVWTAYRWGMISCGQIGD